MEDDREEKCVAIKLHEDEFSGLIRNIASSIPRDKVGDTASGILGNLVSSFSGHGAGGGSEGKGYNQSGRYGSGGYNQGGGYGSRYGGYGSGEYNQGGYGTAGFGSGYGSGGYNQGGYGTSGFGSSYGSGAGFGYGGEEYDSRDKYENRENNSGNSSAFGLVGNLIGGILDSGSASRRGNNVYNDYESGGSGYDDYNRKKPEKMRKLIFATFSFANIRSRKKMLETQEKRRKQAERKSVKFLAYHEH
ncbi:unnamed protein product [Cercopithifilaria johnstoni]|uniref:Uncharacterized protein n=1 Tax=Cercopithifilaria johnstoni TaxID=2874296 RepID=A0A8J2LY20_9BILA|nr:unnamed protein product [Cercopithifilaria johnstoni]